MKVLLIIYPKSLSVRLGLHNSQLGKCCVSFLVSDLEEIAKNKWNTFSSD